MIFLLMGIIVLLLKIVIGQKAVNNECLVPEMLEIHILNCYYNTSESGSLAIGLGGGAKNSTCYVEGTDFAKVDKGF